MFFKNYPQRLYRFGNEQTATVIQDISAYVDIIDQIKDNINFYQKYTILDGDRADILSQKIYGTTAYYWTFYLLNDSIRQQGWPLSSQQIRAKAQADYPNTVLTTRDIDHLYESFLVGRTVTGSTSGATGKILRRNLDLGQIVVSGSNGFTSTEIITETVGEDEVALTAQLVSAANEFEAVHHYEDADKNYADVDPYSAPGALLTAVSYVDRYEAANDALKEIKVIKPQAIAEVFAAYQEALRTV